MNLKTEKKIKRLELNWLPSNWIEKISFGEVINHKTINARSWKPEIGGLFDPKIFGPSSNYECYCGKLKGKQYKGQECPRCQVLIAEKNIQRWRMGHITLKYPVTNILLFKGVSNHVSKILGITAKNLEQLIYFKSYVVIDSGLSKEIKERQILPKKIDAQLIINILQEIISDPQIKTSIVNEAKKIKENLESETQELDLGFFFLEDYLSFFEKNYKIVIKTGSEALLDLLKSIDLEKELAQAQAKKHYEKFRFIKALIKNGIKLEWMIIKHLPVIPSGLRPAVRLIQDGTITTTRINNLFFRILLINNGLSNKEDSEWLPTLSEVVHDQRCRLQRAVNDLIYGNSEKNNKNSDKISLQSALSGKENGLLRYYALGKRTDYSGRAVITPNPELNLNQVGLPIKMALILFKPFLIQKILKEKIAFTVKEAEILLAKNDPVIFPLLSQVVNNYPVLINRAPTLHRLGMQAFYVKLDSQAKQLTVELHPLVTTGFNADFDGDQVAVHLPLRDVARKEAIERMLAEKNIIDPKNGLLIAIPSKDIILGIYHLTSEISKAQKPNFYYDWESVFQSHEIGRLGINELIVVPSTVVNKFNEIAKNKFVITTLGKIIFNRNLPNSFLFYLNNISSLDEELFIDELLNVEEIELRWEQRKLFSGWKKKDIINFLDYLVTKCSHGELVEFLDRLKKMGFDYATSSGITISPFELSDVPSIIGKKEQVDRAFSLVEETEKFFKQGYYNESEFSKKIIEIWTDCKSLLEKYFLEELEKNRKGTSFYKIWDSGARATIENLTQLFIMRGNATNYLGEIIETPIISSLWEGLSPSEFFISVYGAIKGITDTALKTAESGYLTRRLVESSQGVVIKGFDCQTKLSTKVLFDSNFDEIKKKVLGRCLAKDFFDKEGNLLMSKNQIIWLETFKKIFNSGVSELFIRTVLDCELINGLCQLCYGSDLSKKEEIIRLGSTVGIIAAQSLGEPGTQLTMRTFHTGGIARDEDITQGLPKVKQILDNVTPKKDAKALIARSSGKIIDISDGKIKQIDEDGNEVLYQYDSSRSLRVKVGQLVEKGQKLISGKIDLDEYLEIFGRSPCQEYIKFQIDEVYKAQGIYINEKHFEIFARQLLSRVSVLEPGDSDYSVGEIVNYYQIKKDNDRLLSEGKKKVLFKDIITNLKDLASFPNSFLASISFQNTLKSLIHYSLYQPVDHLLGPKENLIIGQLFKTKAFDQDLKKEL